MIIAIDVHYRNEKAKAVSVEFDNWDDEQPQKINIIELPEAEPYVPGEFYKRELPCILEVLNKSDLDKVQVIIIDGYVVLNDRGKPGLGTYLFKALQEKIPIIGVAKKRFFSNQKYVKEVMRGQSNKPLYITAVGIDLERSANNVLNMKGAFRMPKLLQILDTTTKE